MAQDTKTVRVIPCEVYSRVCGYYRPVSGFNAGKKAEFHERKMVTTDQIFSALTAQKSQNSTTETP